MMFYDIQRHRNSKLAGMADFGETSTNSVESLRDGGRGGRMASRKGTGRYAKDPKRNCKADFDELSVEESSSARRRRVAPLPPGGARG